MRTPINRKTLFGKEGIIHPLWKQFCSHNNSTTSSHKGNRTYSKKARWVIWTHAHGVIKPKQALSICTASIQINSNIVYLPLLIVGVLCSHPYANGGEFSLKYILRTDNRIPTKQHEIFVKKPFLRLLRYRMLLLLTWISAEHSSDTHKTRVSILWDCNAVSPNIIFNRGVKLLSCEQRTFM